MSDQGRVIPIDIQGRRYPIRSSLDPHYVAQLAMYVEDKMRAAGDSGPGGDNLRTVLIAFLANLVVAIAKMITGLLSHSSAMLAESAH